MLRFHNTRKTKQISKITKINNNNNRKNCNPGNIINHLKRMSDKQFNSIYKRRPTFPNDTFLIGIYRQIAEVSDQDKRTDFANDISRARIIWNRIHINSDTLMCTDTTLKRLYTYAYNLLKIWLELDIEN